MKRHCLMCGRDTDLLVERCPACRGFLYEETHALERPRRQEEPLELRQYDRRIDRAQRQRGEA